MTTPAPAVLRSALRTWVDENTRRSITQLTAYSGGAHLGYFRTLKHLPDGRVLAHASTLEGEKRRHLLAIDPESGDVESLDQPCLGYLRVAAGDGKTWFLQSPQTAGVMGKRQRRGSAGLELWEVNLPYGKPRMVASIPEHVPGNVADITCDGKTLILEEYRNEGGAFPIPTGHDAGELWRYINRPRSGAIYACDVQSGHVGRLVSMSHVSPAHSNASPTDPTLLRYTQDVLEPTGQRMFMIRTDGGDPHILRPQEYGEMITHEFWWSDPQYIGYTYMDRRDDPTILTQPWCEYAPRQTRLGICDIAGREVYLSDPLNSYHGHLYRSEDGTLVDGEGTDGNNFACVGRFSWNTTKLDLIPLATIRTPWVPTRGSGSNCAFSADGRWLMYNDTVDGKMQICRVKIDL